MAPGTEPAGCLVAVVPVLVGPLQALLPVLAGVAVAVLGTVVSLLRPRAMKQTLRLLWRLKLQVAIVVLFVIVVAGPLRAVWSMLGPAPGAVENGGADWPMVRGGPARRGAPPGTEGPARGGVNWVWTGGGAAYYASPAVVANRVYVSSAHLGLFGGSGAILCFDTDTGALLWQSAPAGYRATFSSPTVSASRLVCGEGLHDTRDARVICLDVSPGARGRVVWTFRTKSHVECAPVIWGDRVFIGAGDDGLYCFDLPPGPDGAPVVRWHLPGERYPDAETSLAVHEGTVYAGLGLGGKALCVLDAETGEERKRIPTPYPVFSPPAIAGGKLYVGMGNGDYVNPAEDARKAILDRLRADGKTDAEIDAAKGALGPAGEVWSIDTGTLEVEWRFKVPRTVLGAVAAADDALYFGSRDGCLYALDRSGQLTAKWDAHAPIITSPAVTHTHVYVVTSAGTLYGLARATLEPVWEMAVGTEPLFISSPTIARGRAYVGTQGDGFVCAGLPGQAKEKPLWAGRLGGPGAAGNPDNTPLPARGAFQWQYPPGQTGDTQDALVTAPPAVMGGALLVPLAREPWHGIACLAAEGDADETPKPKWVCPAENGVHLSPAVSGSDLVFVDGRRGDTGRRLRCGNVETGQTRWQRDVADDASGVCAATPDAVIVQDGPNALTCFDLDGVRQWSAPVGRMDRAAAACESMLVAATVEPPGLVALDRPTGRVLWRQPLDAAPTTSPAAVRSTIYLGTAAGLEARSLADGGLESGWQTAGGGASADFALDRQRIFYLTAKGMMRLALGRPDAEPLLWTDTSWLGPPTAPMVVAGQRIYLGMAGWGLVCLGAGR